MATDFTYSNHGSIVLLTALTGPAQAWVNEYLPEDALGFGPALAIETRFAFAIFDAIDHDGLTLRAV